MQTKHEQKCTANLRFKAMRAGQKFANCQFANNQPFLGHFLLYLVS